MAKKISNKKQASDSETKKQTPTVREEWYEYDKHNNIIHVKTSNGREEWYKYDKKHNLVYVKCLNNK